MVYKGIIVGYFSSFADFLQMGTHGLYVWLSYGIALMIFIYNIVSVYLLKRQFFINAKRRLRREQGTV
ncbi:heme exporter protein D [Bathymodiolus japonicus methanotrophic gill symbiont]|uniref:heme exporter protein CcmD n=1 Tax=Bathymodiolus japonicus methanotrophic gill symbiont TaxID=113269 RepID=UPI001B620624|nr:heme exporter protein CcmD [Bathymodiolus japonicus methanotrophic gill symbiont]GFO70915.1 heme exporter protein D [Bathymodiolus japonicus methanotrophic gill symbiont]